MTMLEPTHGHLWNKGDQPVAPGSLGHLNNAGSQSPRHEILPNSSWTVPLQCLVTPPDPFREKIEQGSRSSSVLEPVVL